MRHLAPEVVLVVGRQLLDLVVRLRVLRCQSAAVEDVDFFAKVVLRAELFDLRAELGAGVAQEGVPDPVEWTGVSCLGMLVGSGLV